MSRPDHVEPEEIPVDTRDVPHEPAVWTRSTRRFWAVLLAGPVIWIVHFAVVYLVAEAVCSPAVQDDRSGVDEGPLRVFIVVATVIAVLACIAAALVAWRAMRRPGASPLHRASLLLAVGSVASVIAVGGPILVLGPC